jgi:CRISPR/Cas system-associated exonuclease Cas4 (RecB family)
MVERQAPDPTQQETTPMAPPVSDHLGSTQVLLDGMPGPRWNRATAIYPSHVHTYLDCPHRCRLQYVDRVPVERRWNRKIEVGNALHKVMEEVANMVRLRQSLAPIDTWRPKVERLLPAGPYDAAVDLTPEDRLEDIENVLLWAVQGQEYITDPRATIIRIERYYPRSWDDAELGSMKLAAKADVVIKRRDERGSYIEIVDYKTGRWQRPIDFAPVLSRISHKPQIHAALAADGFPRVTFTYLWLAQERTHGIEMTREHTQGQWRELKRVLARMLADETWPMRPHPRTCPHCPYYGNRCNPRLADARHGAP